jgi:hypothetical protein
MKVEALPNGRRRLLEPLDIYVEELDRTIHLEAGLESDYSSTPWFARPFWRFDQTDRAGLAHDDAYARGEMTRREADLLWYHVSQQGERRLNRAQALLGYVGLRLGGWVAWRRHRTEQRQAV